MKWLPFAMLLVMCLGVLTGCGGATPTPTLTPTLTDTPMPTLTPTPTDTPTPAFTPTPTPRPEYVPAVTSYQEIATFGTCFNMGIAVPEGMPDNDLAYDCVEVLDGESPVGKLKYTTPGGFVALWIDLGEQDFTYLNTLTFFARGDPANEIQPRLKIELKRQDGARVGVFYTSSLTTEWMQFVIPFEQFEPFPSMPFLCGWDEMNEFVITFENGQAGNEGIVYVDDIYVERRGSTDAPTPDPKACFLNVASFDSCLGVTEMDTAVGAAYDLPNNKLQETYEQEEPSGQCSARLEYTINTWSAFWLKLPQLDLEPYSRLVFDIRSAPDFEPVEGWMIKIEVKRAGNKEIGIVYVPVTLSDQWQTVKVDLENLVPVDYASPLASLDQIEELVFVLEFAKAGNQGVIYLDNIGFEP